MVLYGESRPFSSLDFGLNWNFNFIITIDFDNNKTSLGGMSDSTNKEVLFKVTQQKSSNPIW